MSTGNQGWTGGGGRRALGADFDAVCVHTLRSACRKTPAPSTLPKEQMKKKGRRMELCFISKNCELLTCRRVCNIRMRDGARLGVAEEVEYSGRQSIRVNCRMEVNISIGCCMAIIKRLDLCLWPWSRFHNQKVASPLSRGQRASDV